MAWELEGSGAEQLSGGAAAREYDNWEVAFKDKDSAVEIVCHGAKKRGRERVAGWQGNRTRDSSGVGIRKGGPEDSGVA